MLISTANTVVYHSASGGKTWMWMMTFAAFALLILAGNSVIISGYELAPRCAFVDTKMRRECARGMEKIAMAALIEKGIYPMTEEQAERIDNERYLIVDSVIAARVAKREENIQRAIALDTEILLERRETEKLRRIQEKSTQEFGGEKTVFSHYEDGAWNVFCDFVLWICRRLMCAPEKLRNEITYLGSLGFRWVEGLSAGCLILGFGYRFLMTTLVSKY